MVVGSKVTIERVSNPLDVVEELFDARQWHWDRFSDDEILGEAPGQWTTYRLGFIWRNDMGILGLSCIIMLPSIQCEESALYELVAKANERLWFGHFDIVLQESAIVYRYTLPIRQGMGNVLTDILDEMIETGIGECERFYPAFSMVMKGEKAVTDALVVSVTETAGEA